MWKQPTISMRPHLWRWLCRGCAMNFETWSLPPVGRRGAKMGVVYLPKKNLFLGDCRTLFCVRHFRFIWDFISCHMVCFYSKTEIRLWCCTVFFKRDALSLTTQAYFTLKKDMLLRSPVWYETMKRREFSLNQYGNRQGVLTRILCDGRDEELPWLCECRLESAQESFRQAQDEANSAFSQLKRGMGWNEQRLNTFNTWEGRAGDGWSGTPCGQRVCDLLYASRHIRYNRRTAYGCVLQHPEVHRFHDFLRSFWGRSSWQHIYRLYRWSCEVGRAGLRSGEAGQRVATKSRAGPESSGEIAAGAEGYFEHNVIWLHTCPPFPYCSLCFNFVAPQKNGS